jgi:serine/threonine protein kinase/CheY-like chemotaxis protein
MGETRPAGCVLLVDDEDLVRRALAHRLQRIGHTVLEAETGQGALELLGSNAIDVVLTDITMPDMGGVELLQLVRERKPDVPVLLMTGAPDIDTAVKAVQYGAFEYLMKPFDMERLSASVARAIQEHHDAVARREALESAVRSKASPSTPRISVDGTIAPDSILGGRYRIVRVLGSGGMGTVYEAERIDLAHKRVAVKVLHTKLEGRADVVRRFRREAEVVAAIQHPNIVSVIDFGADEGPTFLVMEFLDGTTLASAIEQGPPFSEKRAAFVAAQTLAALGAAHAVNVIHRDLKPENVFLTKIANIGDVVKVLDFGIAKVISERAADKLTETGTVLGTPAYMAPEYARGEAAGVPGDIYAAGCVLYEMLAGRQPFAGGNYNAIIFAILDKEPEPLRKLRPDVSPELCAVVMRAMAKDPAARFPSALAMVQALERWVPRALATTAPPPIESAPTEELPLPDSTRRPPRSTHRRSASTSARRSPTSGTSTSRTRRPSPRSCSGRASTCRTGRPSFGP